MRCVAWRYGHENFDVILEGLRAASGGGLEGAAADGGWIFHAGSDQVHTRSVADQLRDGTITSQAARGCQSDRFQLMNDAHLLWLVMVQGG
jgi:hypothetical protein